MDNDKYGRLVTREFLKDSETCLNFMGIVLPPMSNVGMDYIQKFGWYFEGQSSKESEYFVVSVLRQVEMHDTFIRLECKLLAQYFSETREYSKDITGTYQEVTDYVRGMLIEMSRATGGVAYSTSKMLKQIHAVHKDGGDGIFRPESVSLYGVDIPLVYVDYGNFAQTIGEIYYHEFSFFTAKWHKSYSLYGKRNETVTSKLYIAHPGIKEPMIFIGDPVRIHASLDEMVSRWLMQEELVALVKTHRNNGRHYLKALRESMSVVSSSDGDSK